MRPTPKVPPRDRQGFTLLEMMIAITLLLLIMGMAVPFFQVQGRAVSDHAGRSDAQQNALFGLTAIEKDLRMAGGVNLPDAQPLIVQAGTNAITFNGDLVSLSGADLGSVYIDPDADPVTVASLRNTNQITLPNGVRTYPDSNYREPRGVPSRAETISFWTEADPQTPGQFRLMRRVNAAQPEVVVRGLIMPLNEPVFRYYRVTQAGVQVEIPQNTLPLYHVAMHDAADDIGASRMTDSIRIIRVRLTSAYRDPRRPEARRAGQRDIRIMNAGLLHRSTCGETPLLMVPLVATVDAASSDVMLTWPAGRDESSGERDVERYALFRRAPSEPFGEPFSSVASGSLTYSVTDPAVPSGSWIYGLAAQDCSAQLSDIASSLQVNIP